MANGKIAVLQTSLGGFDKKIEHVKQTIPYDYHLFTDDNFPPRPVMHPRLQAKIPKMFGWQLKPDYDYYLWLDGNIALNNEKTLEYFLSKIKGYDFVTINHHRRNTIYWEMRYLLRGLKEQSIYLVNRYEGEWWKELYDAIKDYEDKALYIGGIFMYRNSPKVREALKEWWYFVSRYCVQDQLSFPYVLRNLKVNALDHDYTNWDLVKNGRHRQK